MPQITLVRHAQASFGADDYDRLSPLGHEQARALGEALARRGTAAPVRVYVGAMRRHRETLAGMAPALGIVLDEVVEHAGLNEFDAHALLEAHFAPVGLSDEVRLDRRGYFRALRDAVMAWQHDEIADPPETWDTFSARVRAAREAMLAEGGDVLAVSSGGAISRLIVDVLEAPPAQMIQLQLQMRNCGVSRLVGRRETLFLSAFNEAPHLRSADDERLSTYA